MSYLIEDVIIEDGKYWVLKVENGLELYETGITCSTRKAVIDHDDNETNLKHVKALIKALKAIENGFN